MPGGFFVLRDELIEFFALGEPAFFTAMIDVVDGELAGGGILPFGVVTKADAAALQGDERIFHGGESAGELGHVGTFDDAAAEFAGNAVGIKFAIGEAVFQKLALHFFFGLNVVNVLLLLTRNNGG